jgi:hypothetical protein
MAKGMTTAGDSDPCDLWIAPNSHEQLFDHTS